ncbi:hypothetical protein Hanom_Chr08g00728061 [Helianthus anomalus]
MQEVEHWNHPSTLPSLILGLLTGPQYCKFFTLSLQLDVFSMTCRMTWYYT